MSRLSNLYDAMETLRKEKLSTEELEKQVSELEENIIKKEILPIVTENIAPALKQVQRELVLVVDYVPGKPISVHLSRKRNFTAEILDAKEILPDPFVPHTNLGKIKKSGKKTAATQLKISFSNGIILQEPKAADTMVKFVKLVGVEKVRSLNLIQCKIPLVSNRLDEKYKSRQKPLGNGWYLMTNTSTQSKKKDIETIAKAFDISIVVEII